MLLLYRASKDLSLIKYLEEVGTEFRKRLDITNLLKRGIRQVCTMRARRLGT